MMAEKNNEGMLSVKDLSVSYQNLRVLFDVSLEINAGEVVVVVGRNGAGKTTLLRTIAGFLNQDKGSIFFKGQDIGSLPANEVALLGLKYIQQDKHVFEDLTVRENLELGSYATKDYDWDGVLELFPRLKALMDRKGGNLSGGERLMLLMSQSLLGKPDLVLMDEPTEGLAPIIVDMVIQIFRVINETGCPILIVEHALDVALSLATRAYIMAKGKIVFQGSKEELIADKETRKKYLEVF